MATKKKQNPAKKKVKKKTPKKKKVEKIKNLTFIEKIKKNQKRIALFTASGLLVVTMALIIILPRALG